LPIIHSTTTSLVRIYACSLNFAKYYMRDKVKQKKAQHESYLRNKQKVYSRNKERRKVRKQWFREEIMSNLSCKECGEPDPVCLDFHHIDPSTKKETVSRLLCNHRSKEAILAEIAKCVVFCANCHRKHHASLLVSNAGIEPATSRSQTGRSTKLS
jgi:hypothetical protein